MGLTHRKESLCSDSWARRSIPDALWNQYVKWITRAVEIALLVGHQPLVALI
jgi:phosphohistidine phosphatase SixA